MSAAQTIARAYDDAMAAYWRGEVVTPQAIGSWLAAYWRPDAPPEPLAAPTAVSILAAAGAGLRWHQTPTAVLGYVGGRSQGGYVIPVSASPAPFATAPAEAVR